MQFIKSISFHLSKTDNLKSGYWILIFAVYVSLLAATVSRHEPWMDEAQSWLLASDFTVTDLFVKYLRYEGHPSLWYLILILPAKFGLPYFTVNVLSALFAALGVGLFLRYSPFPIIIKILFPFSYFAFFQYAVVARSYCLIPLILFLIAINYKRKLEHPYLYILLLCLLANVSVHTFLMAGTFLFVHLLDVLKVWRHMDKRLKIHHGAAVVIFGLISVQLVLLLAPPPDQVFAQGINLSIVNFFEVSKRMYAGSLVLDEANWIIGLQSGISLAIFIATLFFLRQKKLILLYVLPLLLILTFLAVKYSNLWHEGILFFLWIFVLWVGFDKDKTEETSKTAKTVLVLMTAVLGVQVYWSAYAAYNDFHHNYSGSFQVAEYIKANRLENRKIFASGWKSVAIQPYFNANIFYNYNNNSNMRIWFWSTQNQTEVGINPSIIGRIESEQPDVVVFASDHIDAEQPIEIQGYQFVDLFEGNLYWKTGIYEQNSYWVFRRKK
jgi:hypothetical protein